MKECLFLSFLFLDVFVAFVRLGVTTGLHVVVFCASRSLMFEHREEEEEEKEEQEEEESSPSKVVVEQDSGSDGGPLCSVCFFL